MTDYKTLIKRLRQVAGWTGDCPPLTLDSEGCQLILGLLDDLETQTAALKALVVECASRREGCYEAVDLQGSDAFLLANALVGDAMKPLLVVRGYFGPGCSTPWIGPTGAATWEMLDVSKTRVCGTQWPGLAVLIEVPE